VILRRLVLVGAALALAGCLHDPGRDAMVAGARPAVGRPAIEHLWHLTINDHTEDWKPVEFSSPAVVEKPLGDVILVGSQAGSLVAVDARKGRRLWQAQIGPSTAPPVVLDGRIYVGTHGGVMLALDSFDGHELWRHVSKGAIDRQPVVTAELVIFVNDADRVYALDRATGKARWQYERETPEDFTLRGHAGVVVAGNRVLSGFTDGHVTALDLRTGDVAWTHSLAGAENKFVDVDTTPVVVGDVVYAASAGGGLYALDLATGTEKWRAPIEGSVGLVIEGDRLYVTAAETGVAALDLTGHVLWRQGLSTAGDPSSPVLFGDYLIFTTANAGLFVVRKQSGKLVQSWNPGDGITSRPTLVGSTMYLLSNGGVLYAMNIARY
jgi:outer membrane protein assembly factor BamB